MTISLMQLTSKVSAGVSRHFPSFYKGKEKSVTEHDIDRLHENDSENDMTCGGQRQQTKEGGSIEGLSTGT